MKFSIFSWNSSFSLFENFSSREKKKLCVVKAFFLSEFLWSQRIRVTLGTFQVSNSQFVNSLIFVFMKLLGNSPRKLLQKQKRNLTFLQKDLDFCTCAEFFDDSRGQKVLMKFTIMYLCYILRWNTLQKQLTNVIMWRK